MFTHFKTNFTLLLLALLSIIPYAAKADREINQLQFGKQVITVASDEVITFYDFMGSSDISSSSSSNSQSLTVFTPADAGKSIQITFEEIDIIPDMSSGSYPAYMKVYSGTPSDEGLTWATKASDVKKDSPLPDGNILVTRGGMTNSESYSSTTPETYVSAAADGSMAVGFIYVYAKKCKGWKATVKAVQLENMTVTGAGSNYDGVVAVPSSKQGVVLANAYVTAEGVMNPDNVTGIWFRLTQNEGAVDPTALKLYKGDTEVSTTIAADGDIYKFSLDEALSDGTTTFTVKGDFLGTAAIGAKVQTDIVKIATAAIADGISPFTAGSSITVENPALVLMTATPQTVTVDETPLQFYDEGGKTDGIVSKTNGQVTFLSGVEGKKVMIDFTTNKIWHGTLYNQELRIYNGTEVNAANLIKTLQQGETGIVRSTAADGALTVVLFSDASNDIAADGWEAEVSLFTPQPMDFNGITTAAASTETVAAGDTDQDMLTLTVKALNTEPAMQVTKMAFTTDGTNELVSKAALYFGTTKVGETVVEGSAFDITLATPQTLTEGDNLFTLKYTVSDEAINGQTLSAKAVSVSATVNGAEKTETISEAIVASRKVKNIVISHADQGTVTKTVNGSIAFETKPRSEYTENYESGSDERVNIFVPKHDGMVCQIDIKSFAIYYSSYSTSSCAKFKIYNGQGTSGEVLWEPSTSEDYKSGPNQIIRSTADDGALTIFFNPNNTYSSAAGWKATVSEYLSKDMAVTAVEATQASTADASIGAADQELLTVSITADGNLNPLPLNAVKLNLKGCEANISKVSIWQGDTKVGEANAAAEVEITLSETVTLTEGDNLFAIKADIKSDATENQAIDAKIVSIKAGTNEVAATSGDPDGQRTLKNQILMTEGNHGTISLGLGKETTIYDDGGADGDGADGVEATVTIAPTGEADCIKLIDLGITFSYSAYLYIYKGGEVNDGNLLLTLNGSSAKFEPMVSDADIDGGKITIKYVGKGSYTKPNFAIKAEGYKKTDVVITSVTAEDISVNKVLKGQTDTKMLKIMVEAKGELTPAEITGFNIVGNDGEAVDATHIYQTGTTTTFSANDEFSGSYSITNSGTYYFWVTYDVKTTASEGQTASAQLQSIMANGTAIDATSATASFTVASGKSGTCIVGEGGDYATIQGAIDEIGALGMEGAVVLKIKAGEYNEKVRIPYIKGMGSVNTLTLESESGQRDVKIYHNNYTTAGYSDDQHKKDYGVITLYEAKYVTLKDLEVYTTDVSYKAVVMIKDESRHATIDNCYLHAPTTTTGDVCLIGHTIIDEENKNNDYLTVSNCLLEGGKMGVSMGGTTYVALPKEVGGVIESNTFKNNGTKAIYVMDELGVKIKNNTITIESTADTKISVGILDMQLRDEYAEATEISGNIFNVAPKSYCAVMNLRQLEGTSEAPVLIANNVINLTSLNASYAAFKFNGAKVKYVNVANNTIRMSGENGGAAFWASSTLADGYGNINVVNNIIQNETTGFAVNLFNDGNLGTGKINFQNNVMNTAGSTFFRAATSTTGDFATFVEKTGATGCVDKQVAFTSEDILKPANDLDGDLLTAQTLSYVTTDIDGKTRPTTGITIGAYEYSSEAETASMAEGYPVIKASADEKASIAVKADNAATVYAIIKPSTETAPTALQLKASSTKQTLTAETEAIISFSNLQNDTEYKAYFLLVSSTGEESDIYTTQAFTVVKSPTDPVLTAFVGDDLDTQIIINSGESADITVFLVEGTAPYIFTITDQQGNTVHSEQLTELPSEDDGFIYTAEPTESVVYTLTATDALGKSSSQKITIYVISGEEVATFEDITIGDEGHISVSTDEDDMRTYFVSGSYKFSFGCMHDYKYWYHYGYANSTATTFTSLNDQWNNAVGGGYDNSSNYGIAYCAAFNGPSYVEVLHSDEGAVIPGFFITNTAYAKSSMEQGDVAGIEAKVFGQGDWFKLTATGYNAAGEQTGTTEFYLADFRSENEADHYIVSDWQYFDLSVLGPIKKVGFELTSSDNGEYGMNTPAYFAFDNFGALPEVMLTDAEGYDATDEKAVSKVSYTRTMPSKGEGATSEWGTLCLPFNIPVADNSDITFYTDGSVSGSTLTLTEATVDEIEAGTPVVFHLSQGTTLNVSATATTLKPASQLTTSGALNLTGTYEVKKITDPNAYYIKGDRFWRCNESFNIAPFRAYFTIEGAGSPSFGISTGADDDLTAISQILSEGSATIIGYFDAAGVCHSTPQKGINIVRYSDGHTAKIIIK